MRVSSASGKITVPFNCILILWNRIRNVSLCVFPIDKMSAEDLKSTPLGEIREDSGRETPVPSGDSTEQVSMDKSMNTNNSVLIDKGEADTEQQPPALKSNSSSNNNNSANNIPAVQLSPFTGFAVSRVKKVKLEETGKRRNKLKWLSSPHITTTVMSDRGLSAGR